MQYHPGVPTEQRAEDIVLFAAILLGEYRQGTPLHDIPQAVEDGDAEDGTTFVVEVDAAGSSLSGLLATFGAVQLAVDAAWVAVQYDRVASPEPLDYEFLQELANGPNLSLEIVELSAGTFKGFFKARFPGPVSRAVVTAVAVLSGAAVSFIFPAAVIPTVILSGVIPSMVSLAGAAHDQRATKRQAELNAELQRQINELRTEAQDHQARGKLPTVDNDAVREADVRSVGIDITGRIQISFRRGAA